MDEKLKIGNYVSYKTSKYNKVYGIVESISTHVVQIKTESGKIIFLHPRYLILEVKWNEIYLR